LSHCEENPHPALRADLPRKRRRWIIADACVAVIVFGMAFAQLTKPALLIVCGVLLTAVRPEHARQAAGCGVTEVPDLRAV